MIRRSTWIVLLIFLLLLTATILWQKYKPEKVADVTPTVVAGKLLELSEADIVGFEVKNLAGKSVAAEADTTGKWVLAGYSAEETDTNRIQTVLQQLSSMSILSNLEQAPAADLVGLAQPGYVVSVNLKNGTKEVAYIGNQTPTASGYYARTEGGNIVVVNKYSIDTLVGLLDQPPILPTPLPTETPTSTPEPGLAPTPTP